MLARGIVQPSCNPWASPVVLVRKKDGSMRFCIDYRKWNEVTRKDAYPLPRIDVTLDTLHGSQWFTTLDLLSGYWQVEMEDSDKETTAFCTPEGLYHFRVMPFGLCNATSISLHYLIRTIIFFGWIDTLHNMCNAPFVWTNASFDELRKCLCSSSILAYPDFK